MRGSLVQQDLGLAVRGQQQAEVRAGGGHLCSPVSCPTRSRPCLHSQPPRPSSFSPPALGLQASLVALVVKNPLQCRSHNETQVPSLAGVDPLEEGLATHSSILPWREESGGLYSIGSQSQTRLSNERIHNLKKRNTTQATSSGPWLMASGRSVALEAPCGNRAPSSTRSHIGEAGPPR